MYFSVKLYLYLTKREVFPNPFYILPLPTIKKKEKVSKRHHNNQ